MFFCWDRCTLGPVCFTCSFLQAWPFLWCCDRGRGNRMWGQKLRKVKETPSILARAPAGSSRCGSYMFLHHCPVNYPVLVGNGGMRAEKLRQHKLPELDLLGSMSLRTTIRKRTQFKGAPMRQLFLFFKNECCCAMQFMLWFLGRIALQGSNSQIPPAMQLLLSKLYRCQNWLPFSKFPMHSDSPTFIQLGRLKRLLSFVQANGFVWTLVISKPYGSLLIINKFFRH